MIPDLNKQEHIMGTAQNERFVTSSAVSVTTAETTLIEEGTSGFNSVTAEIKNTGATNALTEFKAYIKLGPDQDYIEVTEGNRSEEYETLQTLATGTSTIVRLDISGATAIKFTAKSTATTVTVSGNKFRETIVPSHLGSSTAQGTYNSTAPSLSDGEEASLQLEDDGSLITAGYDRVTGSNSVTETSPWGSAYSDVITFLSAVSSTTTSSYYTLVANGYGKLFINVVITVTSGSCDIEIYGRNNGDSSADLIASDASIATTGTYSYALDFPYDEIAVKFVLNSGTIACTATGRARGA